jgi:hypothetical protein
LNLRIGASATLVPEFRAERNFLYGVPSPPPVHLPAAKAAGIHGSLFETHNNSIFSARSFFQVGGVKPARENNYGFNLGMPLWRASAGRSHLFVEASQQKARGMVNGNVLVPKADERTPLATDPAVRRIIERFLAAYPSELPNRTDIDPRALNTNAPQRIDTDAASARLDHQLNRCNSVTSAAARTNSSRCGSATAAASRPTRRPATSTSGGRTRRCSNATLSSTLRAAGTTRRASR